jgi:hypothetical protein
VRFTRHVALSADELDDAVERDLEIAGVLCRQIPTRTGWYVRAMTGSLEWQLGEGEGGEDARTFLRLLAHAGVVRVPSEPSQAS